MTKRYAIPFRIHEAEIISHCWGPGCGNGLFLRKLKQRVCKPPSPHPHASEGGDGTDRSGDSES